MPFDHPPGYLTMSSFLQSLTDEERLSALDAITNAIELSFQYDKATQTQSEIQDRFGYCLKYAAIMRRDLHWSWSRIHDTLPQALRCKLDGSDWTPPNRSSWVHRPGSGLIVPPSAL